jgi:hypothetical protein
MKYNIIIDTYDGSRDWYFNGKLHREDGPAIEWTNGEKLWYTNGELRGEERIITNFSPSVISFITHSINRKA